MRADLQGARPLLPPRVHLGLRTPFASHLARLAAPPTTRFGDKCGNFVRPTETNPIRSTRLIALSHQICESFDSPLSPREVSHAQPACAVNNQSFFCCRWGPT